MFSLIRRKDGYSLIEMFLVLMILVIFSITVFSLLFLGSNTYDKLIADKNNEADARIVLSTYNTRLRQYDYNGGCSIKSLEWQNHQVKALVLSEEADPETMINTWLIWDKGVLWEALTINDEIPLPDTSQELLDNPNLDFAINNANNLINIKIAYPFSGQQSELETSTFMRSSY